MRIGAIWVALGLATIGAAQADLSGRRQYPQFRTASGLPGSGIAIDSDGKLAGRGALAISIPVAYSLANGSWVGGVSFTGRDMRLRAPRFDSGNSDFDGNGTAWIMAGLGGRWGRVTASWMALSSQFDGVLNLLYTPPGQRAPLTFAVGVQDATGDGGSSGEAIDDGDAGNSRSLFAVGTYQIRNDLYATAGLGTNRFRFGFAGLSWNATERWSLSAEHDGYNFNGGVAYGIRKLASVGGRELSGSFMIGTIRGKYLHLSANFGF